MIIKKKNSGDRGKIPSLKPKSNLGVMIVAFLVIIILTVVIFFGLRNLLKTESYWVLNTNVPGKVQVTPDMLDEVTVSLGGAPKTAIGLAQVETGSVFTRYPAGKGDILTESNTGVSLDTTTGIPDSWVITSLDINANDAAGGHVTRGDYFDIIGVNKDGGAKYIAINVLALDVNLDVQQKMIEDQLRENVGPKKPDMNTVMQYIFGLPPEAAAKVHHGLSQFDSIKIVKSPTNITYGERKEENLDLLYKFSYEDKVIDLFEGTDSEFTPILRDNNGRPVTKSACEAELINPAELCKNAIDDSKVPTDNTTEKPTGETPTETPTKPTEETPEETPEKIEGKLKDGVIDIRKEDIDNIMIVNVNGNKQMTVTKMDALKSIEKGTIIVASVNDKDSVIKVEEFEEVDGNYVIEGVVPNSQEYLKTNAN